jgi:hypothetical protein
MFAEEGCCVVARMGVEDVVDEEEENVEEESATVSVRALPAWSVTPVAGVADMLVPVATVTRGSISCCTNSCRSTSAPVCKSHLKTTPSLLVARM